MSAMTIGNYEHLFIPFILPHYSRHATYKGYLCEYLLNQHSIEPKYEHTWLETTKIKMAHTWI